MSLALGSRGQVHGLGNRLGDVGQLPEPDRDALGFVRPPLPITAAIPEAERKIGFPLVFTPIDPDLFIIGRSTVPMRRPVSAGAVVLCAGELVAELPSAAAKVGRIGRHEVGPYLLVSSSSRKSLA